MSKRRVKAGALASDSRWTDKESKSLHQLTFPAHFKEPVDLRRVQMAVIRPWITGRVTELLGIEDDVVCDYATSLLEDASNTSPDPRKLQVALTGFLDQHAAVFVDELWKLLLSAQQSVGGIPQEFVERKKKELEAQRAAERAAAESSGRGAGAGAGAGPSSDGRRYERRERVGRGGYDSHHSSGRGYQGPYEGRRDQGYQRRGPPPAAYERDRHEDRRGGRGDEERDRSYGERRYEARRRDDDDRYDSGRGQSSRGYERGRGRSRTRSVTRSPSPRRRSSRRSRSPSYSPSPSRLDHRDRTRRDGRYRPPSVERSRTPSPSGARARRAREDDDMGTSTRSRRDDRYADAAPSRPRRDRSPESSSRTPPYRRRRSSSPPPPSRRRERSLSPRSSQSATPRAGRKGGDQEGNKKDPEERERELREQLARAKRARAE
ncbi:hypothetical protein OC834_001096 [Tilletia horrida]|nr:hypothetical protein OC834_001096 [Tilletia horrida]